MPAGLTHAAAQEASAVPVATPAVAGLTLSDAAVHQFEADVDDAMASFQMVGAAVALVDHTGARYQRGFGVRHQY